MLVEYNIKHSIYFYFNEELDFLILSKRARLRKDRFENLIKVKHQLLDITLLHDILYLKNFFHNQPSKRCLP